MLAVAMPKPGALKRLKSNLTLKQYEGYLNGWKAQELLKVTKKHRQVFAMRTLNELNSFLGAVTIPVGFEAFTPKIQFCLAASNYLCLGWNLWGDITDSSLEFNFGGLVAMMLFKKNNNVVSKAIWALSTKA